MIRMPLPGTFEWASPLCLFVWYAGQSLPSQANLQPCIQTKWPLSLCPISWGHCFLLLSESGWETGPAGTGHADAVIIGVIMGLLNFVGFYAFLSALAIGPLSIVISIMGLHFVIPIILSRVIYAEKLTFFRIFLILLTIVSVIFLKYGNV